MKTIQLSTKDKKKTDYRFNPESNKIYSITTLSELEKDRILSCKQTGEEAIIGEDIVSPSQFVKIGSTKSITARMLSPFVDYYLGFDWGDGRRKNYRDYYFTEEKQRESTINFCEDAICSANSLLRKIKGSEYCLVWYKERN